MTPDGAAGVVALSTSRSRTTPTTLGLQAAAPIEAAYAAPCALAGTAPGAGGCPLGYEASSAGGIVVDVASPSIRTGGAAPPNDWASAVTSWGTFASVHCPVAGALAGLNATTSAYGAARPPAASAWPSAATVAFGGTPPSIKGPTTTEGTPARTALRT